ncbi:MAG: hypothetical protein JXR48_08880 [Candidatus Delongbacteria bacterium]|nr:hypothetical protein [Candidatus Delongbacteria bacterium]MBN2835066.1 hypothetical protein [Candidatus Delongbacteria bacterium]
MRIVINLLLFICVVYAVDDVDEDFKNVELGNYIRSGFLNAKFQNDSLIIGSRYDINEIIIHGDSYFDKQILKSLVFDDSGLSYNNLLKYNDLIGKYYRDNGFPFFYLTYDSLIISGENSVDIYITVYPEKSVSISKFELKEDYKTNLSTIVRESRLDLPFLFNDQILENGLEYLYRTEKFKDKPEVDIYQNSSIYELVFTLNEEKYNRADGMLGYSSNDKNKGFFGYIDLSFSNIFGTFREIGVLWNREDKNIENLMIRYKEPWLYKIPISLNLMFEQEKIDSLYLNRSYQIGSDYKINLRNTISGFYSYERLYPYYRENNDLYHDKTKQGYNLALEYSNSIYKNPFKELFYSVKAEITNYVIDFEADSLENNRILIPSLKSSFVFPFLRFSYKCDLNSEFMFFDNKPEDLDYLSLGGIASIRGYRKDFFRAEKYGLLRNNMYLNLGGESCIYLFSDFSLFKFHDKISDLYTYGTGLEIGSSNGRIEIVYALPHDKSFSEALLHVRFIAEF